MITFTRCAFMAKQACATFSQVVQKITPPSANNFLKFFFVLFAILTLNAATAWAETTTYTFNSKSWGDSSKGWISSKDGNQFTSSQGVQVTTGTSGANATTNNSFTNVSSIAVQYCTNDSKGAGSIKIQVGSNTEKTFSVTKPSSGGKTLKTATFTFDPNETGKVKITVSCTTNSVYIYSVAITTADAVTCTTPPTVSAGSHSDVTTTTATVSCSGGITSLGSAGCSITSYGFVYGTTANPTTSNVQVGTTYTTTGTAFSKALTGLTANTTYYVRPYATNGNGTAYGTQTSFKTLELPKYTVTLKAGPGTCAESVTETSAGAGVTLPTPTLDCGDWKFAGWTTSSVTTKTTSKPEILLTGEYNPTANITLYAVYQRTEETEGSNEESKTITLSPPTTTSGYKEGTKTDSEGNTWSYYAAINNQSGTLYFGLNSNSLNYNIGSPAFDGKVSSVSFKAWNGSSSETRKFLFCSTNTIAQPTKGDLAEVSIPKSQQFTETYTADLSQSSVSQFYIYAPKALGITAISVTYTTSTTYYHSTPECAAPCTDFVTIRKGTSDNGSFNLDKTGEQSTCNGAVTVTLSDIQPAAGYKFSAITQSGVDVSKVTIDNTAKTVTYAKNTTGPSAINVTFEQIPRLAKPTNLKVSSVSCDNASLTWDAVDGTNKYKLVLTNTSTATPTTSNLNTNSAFITLLAGVTYSWTIQAIGDGTTNTDSEVATGENFTTNYTITYNTNGGSDVEDGCGTTLPETLPTTSKNHYTFDGWYLDEMFTTQAEASATLTKNTDLYAKWTANRYTIRFNAGTGTCGTESATATYADGITLPTATPSDVCDEVGWTFAGWATSSVAETTSAPTLLKANDKYQPTSDITLYAVYSTTAETTGFTGYEKVTEEPDDWSGKYLLSTGTFTATGAFDATGKRGHLVRETHTPGTDEKTAWEFTLAKVDNTGYFILFPDGTWYLGYDDGTNFARSTYDPSLSVAYVWTPSTEGITNVSETTRKIQDGGSDFRPYAQKETIVYLYKRIEGVLSTSTYNSNPDCTPPSEYTITWWANGEEYYTQTAVEGTAIDVPTNSPNAATYACDDKVFVGWVDTEIIGSTDTKPTLITEFGNITEDKNFFAVFATEEGGEETTTKVFETGEIGKNGNSITSGYVLIAQASPEEGYYQDGTSADKLYIQVSKVDKSTPMMLSNPSSVVIKANLGGGSTKKLTNPVYAVWLDVNGNEMGNAVIVTDEITNKTGSDFIVSLPVANATEAYGIRVYHQKESGYNVRYYGISLSYTYNTTTYSGYVTTCEASTETLSGKFSTGKYEYAEFATGNLQYKPSTDTWRFAKQQYQYVGKDNIYVGKEDYKGWIDLFGWSADDKFGVNPSNDNANYQGEFVDWGKLFPEEGWSTLSKDQWYYLINERTDATNLKQIAMVGETLGIMLFPDEWTLPAGCAPTQQTHHDEEDGEDHSCDFVSYNYTLAHWTELEKAGAIFLPAAGRRTGGWGNETISPHMIGKAELDADRHYKHYADYYAYYWTSTKTDGKVNYLINCTLVDKVKDTYTVHAGHVNWAEEARYGQSVRLAKVTNTLIQLGDNDNSEVIEANAGKTVNVQVNRTFANDGYYYTLCLPFDLDAKKIGKALQISSVTENVAEQGMNVVFTEAETLLAGQPYLVLPSENLTNPIFEGVKIVDTEGETTETVSGAGINITFTGIINGVGEQTNGTTHYYVGNKGYLYNKPTAKLGLRAFFTITDAAGQEVKNIRARVVTREDAATGFENITNSENTTIKVIENGQLIIIRNGEKFNAQGQKL